MWKGSDGCYSPDQAFRQRIFALNALHDVPHTGIQIPRVILHALDCLENTKKDAERVLSRI